MHSTYLYLYICIYTNIINTFLYRYYTHPSIHPSNLQGFNRGSRTKPNDQQMDTSSYGSFDPFWSNATPRLIDYSLTLSSQRLFSAPENIAYSLGIILPKFFTTLNITLIFDTFWNHQPVDVSANQTPADVCFPKELLQWCHPKGPQNCSEHLRCRREGGSPCTAGCVNTKGWPTAKARM